MADASRLGVIGYFGHRWFEDCTYHPKISLTSIMDSTCHCIENSIMNCFSCTV